MAGPPDRAPGPGPGGESRSEPGPTQPPLKSAAAFRTIGELADELGVAAHVLRYWETRFPQLRPLQRAGNRRYYRAEDAELARRIHRLLTVDGYTVRGVQALLARGEALEPVPAVDAPPPAPPAAGHRYGPALAAIRDGLRAALAADED